MLHEICYLCYEFYYNVHKWHETIIEEAVYFGEVFCNLIKN